MSKLPASDAFLKKMLQDQRIAKDFLGHYLPQTVKELVDLSQVTFEKESYIEANLKRRYSDMVFSVLTKTNTKAFVYVLIEQQSTVDYWMSLRLFKYMLLLSERHMEQGTKKLPLVVPIVFYNGTKKYTAPRNLWDLYTDPKLAKECMANDYQLIDLASMADDTIKQKRHLGILEFFMKHIHERDMLQVWERFLRDFKEVIALDQANDFMYLRHVLWYTDAKLDEEQQPALTSLLKQNLEGGEEIMRTIADKYIEEGVEKGIVQGIEQGIIQGMAQGIEQGIEKGKQELIINMLKQSADLKFIAAVTGYTQEQIRAIQEKAELI